MELNSTCLQYAKTRFKCRNLNEPNRVHVKNGVWTGLTNQLLVENLARVYFTESLFDWKYEQIASLARIRGK